MSFPPPVAGLESDHAAFDGVYIQTDSIFDPSVERVLPVLPEEQVLFCRQMRAPLERLRQERGRGLRVLDIGTGSGVLGIYAEMALNRGQKGELSELHLLDISPRAIELAEHNAQHNGCRGTEVLAHIAYESYEQSDHSYDVILMNPPFNPTFDRWAEYLAIHSRAGALGFDKFLDWLPSAARHLRPDGMLVGYQMSPTRRSASGEWEHVALEKLTETFGSRCAIRYCRSVEEPPIPIRDFLKSQYDTLQV